LPKLLRVARVYLEGILTNDPDVRLLRVRDHLHVTRAHQSIEDIDEVFRFELGVLEQFLSFRSGSEIDVTEN